MSKRFAFEYKIAGVMLVVLVLVSITGIVAYQKFSKVVTGVTNEIRPDLRLVTAETLLSDLTSAENGVKSFTLTQDTLYLERFYNAAGRVEKSLEKLHELSDGQNTTSISLDTLDTLITQKFMVLNELLWLQDQFRVQEALDRVVHEIEQAAASTPEQAEPDEPEKKGILAWLFKRDKQEEEVAEQEKVTLEDLNKEVYRVRDEEQLIEQALRVQELDLILRDNDVTVRIRALLDKLEQEELLAMKHSAGAIAAEMKQTNRQIALACIVTGLLLVFMAYTIVSYVQNNKRYRTALRRAKVEAENLANTKERFLANMSHEIRTPMNAIAGFTEQIAQGSLSKEQREQLTLVQKSTDHLLYIINDVLDFTKLQAQKLKLEKIGFKPKAVIEDVVTFLKPLASNRDIELFSEIREQVPEVLIGDPYRLRQILLNLASNAVKFTEKGTVRMEASVIMHNTASTRVLIKVTDTGIGMKSDQIERVFQEFEQAEVSTASSYSGTGLGLSIVKMLVDLHDGNIEVTSKPKAGTTVAVDIPYRIGTEADLPKEVDGRFNKKALEGLVIMVVDDEAYNRKLLTTILNKHNATYTEVSTGVEAYKEARANRYDLILMDVRMPEMNGIEATLKIRKLPDKKRSQVPIIALTAAVTAADRVRYQEAGMNDFLPKPFKEKQLIEIVNKLLKRGEATATFTKKILQGTDARTELDFTDLRELSNGDDTFFREMLRTFNEGTEEGLNALKKAYDDEDWVGVANQAHKMCAPCRHLSAMKMYKALKEIEDRCRNNRQLETLSELVDSVCKETGMVMQAVRMELDNSQ